MVLDGEYGVRGVALGVPVTLGRLRAEAVQEWDLTAEQAAAMRAAAASVAAAVDELG